MDAPDCIRNLENRETKCWRASLIDHIPFADSVQLSKLNVFLSLRKKKIAILLVSEFFII